MSRYIKLKKMIFFIGMIVGFHVGYTIRVWMRSSIPYPDQKGIPLITSTLSFPCWISIFIWGFINLPWYVVIVWFLICGFIVIPIIFQKIPLSIITKYKVHCETLLIILSVLIWF